MSYNFKKNNIIKGLPFVCFANINATDITKTQDNQITLVFDDNTFILKDGITIFNDNNTATLRLEDILKSNQYKDSSAEDFNKQPLNGKTLDIDFKIVSYKIGDAGEIIDDPKTKLESIAANVFNGSKLIIKVESLYKLVENSKLSDGANNIDIKNEEILYSDLKVLSTIENLEKFIKTKFKEKTFGSNEGCLKDKKVDGIDFDKFFIHECVKDDKLDNDQVSKAFVDKIKGGSAVEITFVPYVNYKINNIKLGADLAKIRKLKDTDINNFKTDNADLLKKQLKKVKYSDIETKIKSITGFNNVGINETNTSEIAEGDVDLEIVKDNDNKFSEVMKGKIKFGIDISKASELAFEDGKDSDVEVIFGNMLTKGNKVINTDMAKTDFENQLARLLGDTKGDKYDVVFTKGFDDTKVIGEFEVTITFKDVIADFTKKLDKDEQNITINLVIDDNSENKYKLVDGLITPSTITFKKDLDYGKFITALEKHLLKGINTLAAAIKEVKYNNGSAEVKWESTEIKTIEGLGIKSVTVIFKKEEKGVYVKKDVSIPPVSSNVTFILKVTTSVNGYKVKTGNEILNVEVAKDGLTGAKFKEEILKIFKDGKFTIKKGNTVINDSDTIGTETSDLNSYSVELTEGSSLIEKVKNEDNKDNKDDKDEQTGDKLTEKKGCCGGKCSGGNKNKK